MPGGDYNFLRRAYGDGAGFLFAWSRFAVIHTGSMALLAFTFGDYLATLVPLGEHGATLFAAATIVALAASISRDSSSGSARRFGCCGWCIAGMLAVIAAGVWLAASGAPPARRCRATAAGPAPQFALGAALVYVFLAYGGWSDTATLSAEMRDAQHGIKRALLARHGARHGALRARELGVPARPVARRARAQRGAGGGSVALCVRRAGAGTDRRDRRVDVDHVDERDHDRRRAHDVRGGARHCGARRVSAAGTSRAARRRGHRRDGRRCACARRVRRLHARRFLDDGRLPVARLLAVPDAERHRVARAAAPLSRRAAAVSRAVVSVVPLAFIASSLYVLYSSLAYVRIGAVAGVGVLAIGVALLAGLRIMARLEGSSRSAAEARR